MKTFGTVAAIGVLMLICGVLSYDEIFAPGSPVGFGYEFVLVCLFGGGVLAITGISNLFQFRDARRRLPGMRGRVYRFNIMVSWGACALLTFPIWATAGMSIVTLRSHQGGCDEFYRRMMWHVWPTLVGLGFCLVVGYSLFGMRRDRKFMEMVARGQPVCMYCGYDLRGKKGRCPECGKKPFSLGS